MGTDQKLRQVQVPIWDHEFESPSLLQVEWIIINRWYPILTHAIVLSVGSSPTVAPQYLLLWLILQHRRMSIIETCIFKVGISFRSIKLTISIPAILTTWSGGGRCPIQRTTPKRGLPPIETSTRVPTSMCCRCRMSASWKRPMIYLNLIL